MNFDFLLIFFLARYMRTSLKSEQRDPDWDQKLKYTMYVSMGLFGLSIAFDNNDSSVNWFAHIAVLGCLYVLYTEPFFKPAKNILIALAPYAFITLAVHLFKLIAPSLYTSWHNYFESLNLFAVLWGIGVWIVTNKQRKELDKAKKQVEEQEENNKMITAMKAELESQVAERTAELVKQKEDLEVALHDLKAAQAQLIQSEKMASLGELTAGIAHEIQNPLNFVNNFSELNKEMIAEMKEEIQKGNFEEAVLIAGDIESNEDKIMFHGRRADNIVKGMLQHSRKNTGQKEPTDINVLCDEYLRLSYHGLRAKDKSFNSDFQTEWDESIGKINVVPQDLGRVFLNLFNNAFYAVSEKKKQLNGIYKPIVTVQTKKEDNEVEIIIKDNGSGIPQVLIEKIFQPFFTTKPTGEGTGLGLSLSYDIITKQHGGTIRVESEENNYTKFIIMLPS